jgi:hypothetical protein
MLVFDLGRIATEIAQKNQTWLEFLRVSSLSTGIHHLRAGRADLQPRHTEPTCGDCECPSSRRAQLSSKVSPGTPFLTLWLEP